MIGLIDPYFSCALADAVRAVRGAEYVAVAHLGVDDGYLRSIAGFTKTEYAERYGVRLYAGPDEMIRAEALDAVLIATEHRRSVEAVEAAAARGLHAYVAKPMATDLAAADRIVEAVRRSGVIATTGPTGRLNPLIRAAVGRVRSGQIGRVLSAHVMHQHGSISAFRPGHWYYDPANGGPELSLGWYVVDLLRWIVGSNVARVYAEFDNFNTQGSPFMDNGKLMLRFANGVMASADIYFSVRWPYPNWELEVMGTDGAVHVRPSLDEAMLFRAGEATSIYRQNHNPLFEEVARWIEACEACQKGTDPWVTVEDARETLRVCLAAITSARTHQPVWLDGSERSCETGVCLPRDR